MQQTAQTMSLTHKQQCNAFVPEWWVRRMESLGATVDLVRRSASRDGKLALSVGYENIPDEGFVEVSDLEELVTKPDNRRKLFGYLRDRANRRLVEIKVKEDEITAEMDELSADDPAYEDRYAAMVDASGELIEEMLRTPASSPAAIAAKLYAASWWIEKESVQDDCIASALADLNALSSSGAKLGAQP